MDKLSKILRESIINEARKIPDDRTLASLPSIYKGVPDVQPFIELGFQHQLAGPGGTAVGQGIYARLRYRDALRLVGSYGPGIVEAKILGGFKNYIMFNYEDFPEIKQELIRYYGKVLTPYEQVKTIVEDDRLASEIANYGISMNTNPRMTKICRNHGIRGLIYKWDGVATVLPFDFSSAIVWAVNPNGRKGTELTHVFDEEARKRYESTFDWDYQLYGRYDWYDKTKITKVTLNNEMYALVKRADKGYNIVHLDTRIVSNPQPKEISDIWFSSMPTLPSIKDGIFAFNYNRITFYGTVCLPGDNGNPALWYPEDVSNFRHPNVESTSDWVDLNQATLEEIYQDFVSNYGYNNLVSEISKKDLKALIKEEISDENEADFIANNQTYVYRATGPSTIKSIFENGQLRQFAGSNDGSWYGEGVYAVVRPEDVQYGKYDKETHNSGVRMIVTGGFKRFLIFEEHYAKKIYGANWQITDQFYELFPKVVADDILNDFKNWLPRSNGTNLPMVRCTWHYGNGTRTTGFLHYIFDNGRLRAKYTSLFSKYNIRGTIYVGGNDGLTALCWNFDQVIPFEYTNDRGRTWKRNYFDFDRAKELAFKNTDPISKFRHLYDFVSDNIVSANINGTRINVTPVKKDGRWNIININTSNGQKISPIDFDTCPNVGLSGIFAFKYKGYNLLGTIFLPGTDGPALWYPEDYDRLNERPSYNSLNDWVGLEDIEEVIEDIKNH